MRIFATATHNASPLGKMAQAQDLIEVGGGSGSIDFTNAHVTTSQ